MFIKSIIIILYLLIIYNIKISSNIDISKIFIKCQKKYQKNYQKNYQKKNFKKIIKKKLSKIISLKSYNKMIYIKLLIYVI